VFADDSLDARLVRALFQANACAMDQQRVIRGEAPVMPLDQVTIYSST
jgi:hypothetical protein